METINVGTLALRELAGGPGKSGDGPVDITTRVTDFNIVTVQDPQTGQPATSAANMLVQFTAASFRELLHDSVPSGIFEFVQAIPTEGGQPVRQRIFLDGKDIFSVKVMSRLL
jgi:hypothetical protein